MENIKSINNKTKYDYIIYHHQCFDGFTGFYLFMKTNQWKSKPIVYPDVPHAKQAPPDIDGKNIIVIDVAYSPKIIKEIAERANKLLFIDHHVSIRDGVMALKLDQPHEIVYDVSYSGASLVWKYFFGKRELMPTFVKYIEDNDIGAWKHDETLPFMAALEINFSLEPSFENLKNWDKLLNDDFLDELVKKGKLYGEYKEYLISKYAKKYSLNRFPSKLISKKFKLKKDKQYKVAVINCGCPSISLVGKRVVETVDCDFCAIWNYIVDKKRYVVSLRSNKADVGKIARYMGGGGHKFASAFSFSSNDFTIDDLFVQKRR